MRPPSWIGIGIVVAAGVSAIGGQPLTAAFGPAQRQTQPQTPVQAGSPGSARSGQDPAQGRGAPPGGARGGTPIPGSTAPQALVFHEAWTRDPMAQPITQANLGNQQLVLHVYGDPNQIRKSTHPLDDYTYTGETTTNWAITVSNRDQKLFDATAGGRFRVKTQNTGWRFVHVILKTADGRYFASEEGAGESSVWIETDFILADMHWRNLLMTDTPSNGSNRRQPDPKRVPIIPTSKGAPDLTQIEEIGYSDLMEGGWIPATARVAAFDFFGKVAPRKE
jgi:hypothetical protein